MPGPQQSPERIVVPGRPPVKHEALLASLRKRIVDGEVAPGERLPSIRQMEASMGASRATIQQVLHALRDDGFVETRVGAGTRVAPHPPHLCRYGIVLPARRGQADWTNYYETICAAAKGVIGELEGCELVLHEGLKHAVVSEVYHSLVQDVERQRCAGLIFPVLPFQLAGTPVINGEGIPRVVVGPDAVWQGCNSIATDRAALDKAAMTHLADHACQRIAVIVPASPGQDYHQLYNSYQRLATAAGLDLPPDWLQGVHLHTPDWTRNHARLLFHEGHAERPDGLLISDDNLVQAVVRGVLEAGVRVPDELRIVVHSNFPRPPKTPVPVHHLGFDLVALIRQAVALIDKYRRHGAAPVAVTLPPVSEAPTWAGP